jgi:hypothetical protein
MLNHQHADRRQLRYLMAAESPARRALIRRELTAAAPAGLRVVIDDLIHLVFGLELSPRARMTGLTTRLALPAQELLRFRPRLRSTLLPCLRRI